MLNVKLSDVLRDVVGPLFRRPRGLQVAALCYRKTGAEKEVLLITSRDTGRWIIPKGWPMRGKTDAEAALQEAWEEAGVKSATIEGEPIGSFAYDKVLSRGLPLPVEAQVYSVRVEKLCDSFPEAGERTRKWMSPAKAANLVDEPQLKEILRAV